jgi:hypothetical protein
MVLFSSYVVALRDQDFPEETQARILAKTTSALTKIYTTEVLSKPRKRHGVYRASSTPFHTSKKVPADQRIQFSVEEVKLLKHLNEQIGTKLYSQGITAEQFMHSLAKEGRVTLTNLKDGLGSLNLAFSSEEIDLLLRKYNAQLDFKSKVNYGEFTHLFPNSKRQREEDGDGDTFKEPAGEHKQKERAKPKRALTLNPFPETIPMPLHESDSEPSSLMSQDAEYLSDDDDFSDREHTPPRDHDEET